MSAFTRIACIALVLMGLSGSIIHGVAADDEKPRVFINTASHLLNILPTNAGMARFAEIARDKGFEIDHGQHQSFAGGAVLEGIDIYVFLDTTMLFPDEDRIALRQWVRDGGILIIGDWTAPAPADGFMTEFGVELEPIKIASSSELSLTPKSPLAGPLKINKLKTEGFRPLKILDPTKAEEILSYEDGKPAMIRSISHAGDGEIITIGCLNILINDNMLSDGNIEDFDNDKLVQNLFDYMRDHLGLNDTYDLKILKVKAKGSGSFLPGDKIKLVSKIKNIGKLQSEQTEIAFYLEDSGSSSSKRIKLSTAGVKAMNANKRLKVSINATLPGNLAEGKYSVIAVIDPDSATDDANKGNNTATAKKKIIVE